MYLLLNKKSILGLILCVLILSASIPLLLGLKVSPFKAIYGNDVLTLTQATTDTPLNTTLIRQLEDLTLKEEWVQMISPEVYVFCVVKDNAVVVRGVNTSAFLSIEDAQIIKGVPNNERTALIGEGLSRIINLDVGDSVLVTGSTRPSLLELKISGIYSSSNPSNDEMVISHQVSRKLAGIQDNTVMAIRVKTSNGEKLVHFLNENKITVVVSGGDAVPDILNSNVTYDSRLINLLFEYSDETFSQDLSLTTAFINQGVSSVSIVVLGFIILNAGLTFIGVSAIMTRALEEKKKDIGILSAIGADKRKIRFIILKDIFILTVPTCIIGITLGLLLAHAIGAVNLIMVFGHSIKPVIDWVIVLEMAILIIVISSIVGLYLNEIVLKSKPGRLIQELDVEEVDQEKLEDVLA